MIKQFVEGLEVIKTLKHTLEELDTQAKETVSALRTNGVILDKYAAKLKEKP